MNPTQEIDKQIASLSDWRGELYSKIRVLIHEANPKIKEEFKWGTGVFIHNGNVCAIGAFKDHMKINFFKGAALEDPHKLFNAGLEAKTSRSVDIKKGDTINEVALKELIHAAIAQNA